MERSNGGQGNSPGPVDDTIWLDNDMLAVQVRPAQGGGIGRFQWRGRDRPLDLFRPYLPALPGDGPPFDPNRLGCYPLVPWSNRISAGGFQFHGAQVQLSPNCPGEPFPIHGTGWRRAWTITSHTAGELHLALEDRTAGAYHYHATLAYALRGNALTVELGVTNAGQATLPFGLGLHPFIALHDGVSLHAPATGVWQNDGHSPLPHEHIPVPAEWDFSQPKALPGEVLNHGFVPWSGQATVRWPRQGLMLRMAANVDAYLLYTPTDTDFFCFEPVDHPIDAVHLPGGPLAHGMTALAPGETLRRIFSFHVDDDGTP